MSKEKSNCNCESHWDIQSPKAFGHLGSHFSMAVLDIDAEEIVYGDSLGWSPPNKLHEEISQFYKAIFKEEMSPMQLIECHNSNESGYGHKCTSTCSLDYPLQKDGSICGVVVIVMLAIASLSPDYFDEIVRRKFCSNKKSSAFFRNPTMYSKYMQQVIMAWFSEERISMKYLIGNGVLQDYDLSSDSDEQNDGVIRVNFEITDSNEILMSSDMIDVQERKVVARKDEAQHSDRIYFCVKNDKEIDVCVNIEDQGNHLLKEEVAEKNLVQNSKIENHINMEEDMVGTHAKSDSLCFGRQIRSHKSFNCHRCSFTTARGFNLRRHMKRHHGHDNVKLHESGGCICLECGHKCFLIKDLREHLRHRHGFIFRIITKEFQHISGRTF